MFWATLYYYFWNRNCIELLSRSFSRNFPLFCNGRMPGSDWLLFSFHQPFPLFISTTPNKRHKVKSSVATLVVFLNFRSSECKEKLVKPTKLHRYNYSNWRFYFLEVWRFDMKMFYFTKNYLCISIAQILFGAE